MAAKKLMITALLPSLSETRTIFDNKNHYVTDNVAQPRGFTRELQNIGNFIKQKNEKLSTQSLSVDSFSFFLQRTYSAGATFIAH